VCQHKTLGCPPHPRSAQSLAARTLARLRSAQSLAARTLARLRSAQSLATRTLARPCSAQSLAARTLARPEMQLEVKGSGVMEVMEVNGVGVTEV